MALSKDALIFGFGSLHGSKQRMTFGGEGSEFELHPRTRAALNELLEAGYAEPATPEDQIPGREAYRGTDKEPSLGKLLQETGYNPFSPDDGDSWPLYQRIDATAGPRR